MKRMAGYALGCYLLFACNVMSRPAQSKEKAFSHSSFVVTVDELLTSAGEVMNSFSSHAMPANMEVTRTGQNCLFGRQRATMMISYNHELPAVMTNSILEDAGRLPGVMEIKQER